MKKTVLFSAFISAMFLAGCDRDVISLESTSWSNNANDETPTASFDVTAKTLTGTVVPVVEGTPVAAREVTIKYTGTPTFYKAVYMGDAGRIFIDDPANPPAGVNKPQAGQSLGDSITHTYSAAGTYEIVVVSNIVNDKGRDVKRAIARKRITLQ